MNRLCEIGDIIKSNKFATWRPQQDGSYHLSNAPWLYSDGNEWLVIKTEKNGGGSGHGVNDVYPDGHEVTIQMLPTGTYTPLTDLTLKFYQTGAFTNVIAPGAIDLIKSLKLELKYSWQELQEVINDY